MLSHGRIAIAGYQFTLATGNVRQRAESIDLQFFCGVRRYVALECDASIEDLRNHSDAT